MREYDPCIGCEYYNKPYWSVVSPCKNCYKTYGYDDYVATTTTNISGLIVDDLVEDFKSYTSLNLTNNDVYGSDSIIIGGYVQGNTLEL